MGRMTTGNPTAPIKNNQSKGSQTPSVSGPAVGHTSGNSTKGGGIVSPTKG